MPFISVHLILKSYFPLCFTHILSIFGNITQSYYLSSLEGFFLQFDDHAYDIFVSKRTTEVKFLKQIDSVNCGKTLNH